MRTLSYFSLFPQCLYLLSHLKDAKRRPPGCLKRTSSRTHKNFGLDTFGSNVGISAFGACIIDMNPYFTWNLQLKDCMLFLTVTFFFFPQHGSLTRSCHYQLFNISKIRNGFTAVAAQAVGQTLWAFSHWDYWYSLMESLPVPSFSSLQLVPNSARLNFLLNFGPDFHLFKESWWPFLSQRTGISCLVGSQCSVLNGLIRLAQDSSLTSLEKRPSRERGYTSYSFQSGPPCFFLIEQPWVLGMIKRRWDDKQREEREGKLHTTV